MSDRHICHICGTETDTWCPTCTASFATRRKAEDMTPDERMAEMILLSGPLEYPFELVHQRIEELIGRPVWTHKLGTSNWPNLIAEARDRTGRLDWERVIFMDTGG